EHIERRREAAGDGYLLVTRRVEAAGDGDRIIAAAAFQEAPGRAEQMMAAAVGGEEGLAATLRTVEDSGQIDAGFSDQPAAKLERQTGRRQRFGAVAQGLVKRGGHFVDVERLLPGEARDVEAAAEVQLGKGHF